MNGFKQLLSKLKKRKVVPFVTEALDRGVALLNEDRVHERSGYFNVSDLGYCLRQIYFRHTEPEAFEPRLLKIFASGVDGGQRAVAFLRRAGVLFGASVCPTCGTLYCNMTPPDTCGCGTTPLYSEVGIRNHKARISGKVDLFVQHDNVILVEVKQASTYYRLEKKQNIIDKLHRNVEQANMYVGMIRAHLRAVDKKKTSPYFFFESLHGEVIDGYALGKKMDTSKFILLYEDKNSCQHYPHEFSYDHELYKSGMRRIKEFFKYLDASELPPKEPDGKNCKYCDYVKECNKVSHG